MILEWYLRSNMSARSHESRRRERSINPATQNSFFSPCCWCCCFHDSRKMSKMYASKRILSIIIVLLSCPICFPTSHNNLRDCHKMYVNIDLIFELSCVWKGSCISQITQFPFPCWLLHLPLSLWRLLVPLRRVWLDVATNRPCTSTRLP